MAAPAKPNLLQEDVKRKNFLHRAWLELNQTRAGRDKLSEIGMTQSPLKRQPTVAKQLLEAAIGSPDSTLIPAVGLADMISAATGGGGATKDAEATVVSALSKLRGLPGVHPSFNPEAALELLAKNSGISDKGLWHGYGVFVGPEGALKTNISDKGAKLTGEPVPTGSYSPIEKLLSHPNWATILEAEPRLKGLSVTNSAREGSNASYSPIRSYTPEFNIAPKGPGSISVNADSITSSKVNTLSNLSPDEKLVSVLLHETGHAVQKHQPAWSKGSNLARSADHPAYGSVLKDLEASPEFETIMQGELGSIPADTHFAKALRAKTLREETDYEVYLRNAGEQEASAVQKIYRFLQMNSGAGEFSAVPTDYMIPRNLQLPD